MPIKGLPRGLSGKKSACNAGVTGDAGLISVLGSFPGGGNGCPLEDSRLENPMDRGARRATVLRITERRTQLKPAPTSTTITLQYFSEAVSVQFSRSVSASLRPMDCSTTGFPVHHQLAEPAQTHVHRVGDAIQSSHPLWSPSPPAFSLSQHQGLFQGVSSLHQVAKVLEFQLQHQSFQ